MSVLVIELIFTVLVLVLLVTLIIHLKVMILMNI
jgi:hypothetical protein